MKSPKGEKQGSPSFLSSQHKMQSEFRQQFVQPDAHDAVSNGHIDLGQHQEFRQQNQQHYSAAVVVDSVDEILDVAFAILGSMFSFSSLPIFSTVG